MPEGFGKWHGGVVASDGFVCMELKRFWLRRLIVPAAPHAICAVRSILGIPAFANKVLRIRPDTQTVETIGEPLNAVSDKYRQDARYKFGGGVLGPDGAVYAFPSDADFALRIVAKDRSVEVLSNHGRNEDGTPCPTPFVASHNKWQNGFVGKDGAVYAIPCNAPAVLRIVPPGEGKDAAAVVELVGGDVVEQSCKIGLPASKAAGASGLMHDKWEGGVVGLDGALYCMPQNSKYVLRVDGLPAEKATDTIDDGVLVGARASDAVSPSHIQKHHIT